MRLAAIALCVFLGACASVPGLPAVVKVPVTVPCLSEPVKSPALITDADLLALDDYGFVIALARDRIERRKYELQLEAAMAGCL